MKKLCYLFICLFLVSCGSDKTASISSDPSKGADVKITAQSVIAQMENGHYKDGELIVRFKGGVVKESSLNVHKSIGAAVKKRSAFVPALELVQLPKGISVEQAVSLYMANSAVEHAEPNYIRKPSTIPSDTSFGQQWALNNTGTFAGGTPNADINAPEAWDVSTGSRNVIIAVIDSGIDYNQPDLVQNIWKNPQENCTNGLDDDGNGKIDDCQGWNFFSNNPEPFDDVPHGTHVAGIIGARGNNMMGISGVMWDVQMMPLKFIGYHEDVADCGGDSHFCGDVWDEIDAIHYAISKGAKIINASYGDYTYSPEERNAISDANALGVLFVASAGNQGANNDLTPAYPASHSLPNIISVAATDQNDQKAAFSNFGPTTVDVAAPGVYILSTIPTFIEPNGYDFFDGTSMAAPHVSGLAGLLWGYYTHFTPTQVIMTIYHYTDHIPSLLGFIGTAGRINAYRSISSLQTPASAASTVLSTSSISLTWVDKATGESGYLIERKPNGGVYALIASLPTNTSAYTDNGLVDGTRYFYRIKAVNTIPAESRSVEISNTTPLNQPGNLAATRISNTNVLLEWSDHSSTESGFKIERKTGGSAYTELATVGTNISSFNDFSVSSSTRYEYRVRAFNATGYSDYSNEVSIRTGGHGGGGGGGCSLGAKQNPQTAFADVAILLAPFAVLILLRRQRR
jgi:subtilisin family serine protease